MKDSDKQFLKLFHNNLVGLMISDEDHIIVDVNEHLLQLIGVKGTDIIGKTGLELPILDDDFVKKYWRGLMTDGQVLNQELSFKLKNTKEVDILFSTEKIELDDKLFWLTTVVEITKRKKSEKALSNIYERVSDAFVAIDKNWCYTYVNKKAGELLEKDPAYLVGKHIWTEFPEDIGQPVYLSYHEAMETQQMIAMEEYYEPYNRWFQNLIYPSADGLSVFFSDITIRKKALDKIKESEIRFRTLTKNAPVGIFETDANGLTTYVNETWMGFTGMQFEEAMGEGWLNAVHPEDRKKLETGWYSNSEKDEPSISEYRLVDKKAGVIWVNGNAVPVVDDIGVVTGYIGTITDVTAIKNAVELLQKKEETLNKAQNISKVGSWEFNLATGELAWSEEQYRIFELEGEPAETLYQAYRNKYHPDDLIKLDEVIKNAIEKAEGFTFEHRILCNDGSIKYISSIGEVILNENGKVVAIKGIGQDITNTKQNELEIIRTHQKIDTLINTVDGIVWEADAKTFQFSFISKKAEEILGYPAEDWINDHQFWASHIHPDDRNWAIDYCVTCTREKKQHDFEYRMIAKDGREIWLRDIVSVIVENDQPVLLRGIMIDITEKKKSEKILEERTEQLRELSSHLQNVREEERMNIAREIHDELGQQLTGLKMDIAWLMKKVGQEDQAIKSKFNDALILVDSTVKSIRRIATELRPSIIDDLGLNAALEWLVSEFTERLNVEIEYENNFDDKNVAPDIAIGLFRILQESLTNIAKHANASKIKISIIKEPDAIKLLIADNGIGFDSTTKPSQLSFGLLGIKERTHMLKGAHSIFTKPGKGTKIEIRIPL